MQYLKAEKPARSSPAVLMRAAGAPPLHAVARTLPGSNLNSQTRSNTITQKMNEAQPVAFLSDYIDRPARLAYIARPFYECFGL